MEKELSIIIITSPHASMPSVTMIQKVIKSFSNLHGVKNCNMYIIFDGYKLIAQNRTKKGQVTESCAQLYIQYYENVCSMFEHNHNVKIIRCESHYGFAFAVKYGLEICNTKYALITQHDRPFCCQFLYLSSILSLMDSNNSNIRYVGFPSINNIYHDREILHRYGLKSLQDIKFRKYFTDHSYLQPCIFWYDSQHLCNVQKYLEIYKPYRNFPIDLRSKCHKNAIKDMLLRPGDFIEDRFGQMQRNNYCHLLEYQHFNESIERMLVWYGSYLVWMYEDGNNMPHPSVMVYHLRGREKKDHDQILMDVDMANQINSYESNVHNDDDDKPKLSEQNMIKLI